MEDSTMKKQYMKPTMQVVMLQHQHQLLAGGPYDSVSKPLDTYDDDVITDKGSIW